MNLFKFYRIKNISFPLSNLKIEDLKTFKIIGIFERKILIGFSQKLNIFCYFDQHAMHERIRY
jgi:hypothetical protein